MPASWARRRFAGEVITRPGFAGAAAAPLTVPVLPTGAVAAGAAAAAATAHRERCAARRSRRRCAAAPPPTSNTMSGDPTATLSPGSPEIDSTRPLTGAGTSTAALSVITSTMS